MAVFSKWEDYNLPAPRIGKSRSQTETIYADKVFAGPLAQNKYTETTITTWDVRVVCDMREAIRMREFIYDVVGVTSRYFYMNIKTERSYTPQLVRIISGIPQPRQLSHNAWEYAFKIEAAAFDFTESGADVIEDIGENYIRTPGYNQYTSMIRGLANGSPTGPINQIAASRDRRTVVCAGGNGSISKNSGSTWVPLYIIAASGAPLTDYVTTAAVSDDGKLIICGTSTGYFAMTRDGGATWAQLPRFLGADWGGPVYDARSTALAMSGNGQLIVACMGGDSIEAIPQATMVSYNAGVTWAPLFLNNGSGAFSTIAKVLISKDGDICLSVTKDGFASISVDGAMTFSVMTRYLAPGVIDSCELYDACMSDSGAVILVCGKARYIDSITSNEYTGAVIIRSTNYGSSFESTRTQTSPTALPITAIACSSEGSVVTIGMDDVDFAAHGRVSSSYGLLFNNLFSDSDIGHITTMASDGKNWFFATDIGVAERDAMPLNLIESSTKPATGRPDVVTARLPFVVDDPLNRPYVGILRRSTTLYSERFIAASDNRFYGALEGDFDDLITLSQFPGRVGPSTTSFNLSVVMLGVGESLYISNDSKRALNCSFEDVSSRVTDKIGIGHPLLSISSIPSCESAFITFGNPGIGGAIGMITNDYGFEFSEVDPGFNSGMSTAEFSVMSEDGSFIMVAGADGRAAVSTDGGLSFNQITRWQNSGAASGETLIGLCASADCSVIYVLYNNGMMARSFTKGVSWVQITALTSVSPVGINSFSCTHDGQYLGVVCDNVTGYSMGSYGDSIRSMVINIPSIDGQDLVSIAGWGTTWAIFTSESILLIAEPNLVVGP